MTLFEEVLRSKWQLAIKEDSREYFLFRGSPHTSSDERDRRVSQLRTLGHVIAEDGGYRPDWNATRRKMWQALYRCSTGRAARALGQTAKAKTFEQGRDAHCKLSQLSVVLGPKSRGPHRMSTETNDSGHGQMHKDAGRDAGRIRQAARTQSRQHCRTARRARVAANPKSSKRVPPVCKRGEKVPGSMREKSRRVCMTGPTTREVACTVSRLSEHRGFIQQIEIRFGTGCR